MSNIPSTFSRKSECLQRKCEQFPQRIHPVTLIKSGGNTPDEEESPHILYHNAYVPQSMPNHYHVKPNEYKTHYRSDQSSQFSDQDTYICSNYQNIQVGDQNCLNGDFHGNTLYPDSYMSYMMDPSLSGAHMNNQSSFFTPSNMHQVSGSQHSSPLPFSNVSEKPVAHESDILLNSFVGNLTPSGLGMYSQFGESNGCSSYSSSNLINTFEQPKPELSPIKKMEKKQTKLLYSDVLNRALVNDKLQTTHIKDNNLFPKEKLDKSKSKKLERRKSCPCVNNSPEHSPQQSSNSSVNEKEYINKGVNKIITKEESSGSDQDEVTAQCQNTQKAKSNKTSNSKTIKKESASKDIPSVSDQSNPITESSPRKQFENYSSFEKVKPAGKKINKQIRTLKQEKIANYGNKKNKTRKKKKYFVVQEYLRNWQEVLKKVGYWFWTLLWDITTMSSNLAMEFLLNMYTVSKLKLQHVRSEIKFRKILDDYFTSFDNLWAENSAFAFWRKIPFLRRSQESVGADSDLLNLAKTREEAMEHLLLNKDKDPYSILYLDVNCTGDQIRRHYKRLAMLVHPDKNDLPQAEEAFKILQKAFDVIGEPELRATYDLELARQQNAQTALNQFGVLLTELQEKIVRASNTIRCTNCNGRHLRVLVDRPCYAARECAQCKIKHSAKEGDIWAETRMLGLRWVYLACMEGSIYDISEWAACQKSALAHLTANSHNVQYRIVLSDRTPRTRPDTSSSSFQEFLYNYCTSSMNHQASSESSSRRRSPRQN